MVIRIALAAVLACLASFQTLALAQDQPVRQLPVEPTRESVIAHFFPDYMPVQLGDLSSEIGALTVSDPAYDSSDRSPTSIKADFDGNGFADYALLIRKAGGTGGDEIFTILMGHGQGRYSKAIESFFGGVAQDIYLGYLPAGTNLLTAGTGEAGNTASITLANPALTLNVYGQPSDVFFWDADISRFLVIPGPTLHNGG